MAAWRLPNIPRHDRGQALEAGTCAGALERGRPDVFNNNWGGRFNGREFTQALQDRRVKTSRDGAGRCADNIFVERLWRTVKYEEVYLKTYVDACGDRGQLGDSFRSCNDLALGPIRPRSRPGQAREYRVPAELLHGEQAVQEEGSEERRCSPEMVTPGGMMEPLLASAPLPVRLTALT